MTDRPADTAATDLPGFESAFAVAINTDPRSISSARRISHDNVLKNTGSARRSGVQWTHYPAADGPAQLAEEGLVLPDDVRMLCDRFPQGVLILATVEVDPNVPSPGQPGMPPFEVEVWR